MVLHYKEFKCPKENIVQLNKVLSEQIVYDKIAMLNTSINIISINIFLCLV